MGYLGEEIKKLGFGFMRLPMNGEEVDLEQTCKMVDKYMDLGFTYFDTAYVYMNGKSEEAVRDAVVKRYPREAFQLATKMPLHPIKEYADYQPIFDTSLERTQAGYFDFYLLHALNRESNKKAEETGGWEFVQEMKKKGLVKHAGFSFHDSAEALEEILSRHPEAEFVQLQINYADWESDSVQSRQCYEVARKYNVPVIVMEPVKGGTLAVMSEDIEAKFKAFNPEASVPSWAIRYAASLDGMITVLSGMSNMEQLEDNVSYMNDFNWLTDDERKVIDEVVEIFNKAPRIPCTTCKYCVDDCPMQINIPRLFGVMNHYMTFGNKEADTRSYNNAVNERGKASQCLQCGACEGHCPQHIEIIEELKKIAATFEE